VTIQEVQRFIGNNHHVGEVALSPDGKLAQTRDGQTIRAWPTATGPTRASNGIHCGKSRLAGARQVMRTKSTSRRTKKSLKGFPSGVVGMATAG
jgi:hypothetical protein